MTYTFTEQTSTAPDRPSRIVITSHRHDLGDDQSVILVKATWTDGPHEIEGYGVSRYDAVKALADRIGDVLHALTEHPST